MSKGETASLLGRSGSFGGGGGRRGWSGETVKTIGFFGSVVLISERLAGACIAAIQCGLLVCLRLCFAVHCCALQRTQSAVNNISGPAMLDLPRVFDAAGIIPTSLAIIVTCVISSLVATMLAGERLLRLLASSRCCLARFMH